jgi:FtsH-binding integral membrane protein
MNYVHTAEATTAADALPEARATFIRRTYLTLSGAIAAFAAIETVFLQTEIPVALLSFIVAFEYGWLSILGVFIVTGWLARTMAATVDSVPLQYLGLACYVFAEAVIFAPLLYLAVHICSPAVLPTAAVLTITLFLGLTSVAFITREDYSYLGSILTVGGMVAIGLIVCGVFFGFDLGLAFSFGMIVLAGIAILHDTSKMIHHFRTDQHVAAALELFASVALMFWYVIQILMRLSRR